MAHLDTRLEQRDAIGWRIPKASIDHPVERRGVQLRKLRAANTDDLADNRTPCLEIGLRRSDPGRDVEIVEVVILRREVIDLGLPGRGWRGRDSVEIRSGDVLGGGLASDQIGERRYIGKCAAKGLVGTD